MATATEQVLGRLEKLEATVTKSLTPIEGLLKMAQEPASKAGVKAEEWLMGQFNRDGVAFFDAGAGAGHTRRKSHRSARRKSYLGRGERGDGKPGSFGEYLKAMHDFHCTEQLTPEVRTEAARVLKSYGQQQWKYSSLGARDMVTKSDMLESSAVTGGYLVAPQYDERLYEIEIEESIIDNYAQQHPMTSRTKIIAGLDQVNETFTATAGQSNLLAGVKFYWAAEGATRQQTNPRFRNVVLNANELSFYAGASNTLLQDVDGLDMMITSLFRRAVAWGVDWSCFRGNGVGQPLGLQNAGCAINVSRQNANQVTIQDVENMFQYVYFPSRNENLIWVAHPSCIPWILRLNDQSGYTAGTGRRVFIPLDQGVQADIEESDGPRGFGHLFGKKLLLSEKVPALGTTGDLGLYNMEAYAQGRRMDVEIMVSPHVQFLQNSSVWRVVLRMDGQPLLGRKITYADAGTYASPVILLN